MPAAPLRHAAIGGAAILLVSSYALGRPASAGVEAASPVFARADRPDVLLIVMDTVHAEHLSVYGYDRDTTPNLRDLARDSMVYINAISASDITLSSHASLFTGMYPSWHGAYCDPRNAAYGRAVSDRYPTLAELLRSAGYHTTGVAANLYLRADFGLERGFDRFAYSATGAATGRRERIHATPRVPAGVELRLRYRPVRSPLRHGRGYECGTLRGTRGTVKPGPAALHLRQLHGRAFSLLPPAPYDDAFRDARREPRKMIWRTQQQVLVRQRQCSRLPLTLRLAIRWRNRLCQTRRSGR